MKNAKNIQTAEEKKLNKEYWGLSIPIMIEFLIGFSIPAVDAYFLSKISLNAAVAVGAVLPIIVFCEVIYGGLNSSAKSLAAQALGENNPELAKRVFSASLFLVMLVSAVLLIIFILFTKHIISWLGLTGEVADVANDYLLIMGCGYLILGSRYLFQVMNALYGIVKFNIGAACIMLSVNAVGDAAVVYNWWGLGVYGASGVAAVSIISVFVALIYLVSIQYILLGFSIKPKTSLKDFLQISKVSSTVAIPAILEPLSLQLFLIFMSGIIARIGDVALAMRVLSSNIFLLCFVPGLALSVTSQILAGNYIGQKNYAMVEKLVYKTVRYGIGIAIFMVVPIVIFGEQIISIFTNNTAVLSIAVFSLIPLAIAEPFKATNLVNSGDGFRPTVASIAITWLISVPLCLIIAPAYGFIALLWVIVIDEILKASYNLYRWLQGKWKMKIIEGLA